MASVPLGRSTESAGGEGSVASRFRVQARGIGASDLGSSLRLGLGAQNLRLRTCASGACGHGFWQSVRCGNKFVKMNANVVRPAAGNIVPVAAPRNPTNHA